MEGIYDSDLLIDVPLANIFIMYLAPTIAKRYNFRCQPWKAKRGLVVRDRRR